MSTYYYLIVLNSTYTKIIEGNCCKIARFFVTLWHQTCLTNHSICMQNNHQQSTKILEQSAQSVGRTELAQQYFPDILPRSAWQKLKPLMLEDPELSGFVMQRRRTLLPSEVNIIYQRLGHP